MRLPTGLAGSHLGPSGQGGSHQVWALLKVTLLSYYPMVVAPPLDPPCEAPEAIQVDAGGLVKEVLDVGHKVQWTGLLNLQGFLLVSEEVVEEPLLDPGPVSLHEIVYTILVIDLQNVFKVLSPPTAVKVRSQPHRIPEGRPCLTSLLRLGSLRCWRRRWWEVPTGCQPGGQTTLLTMRLCTHHLRYTSWVTNGATAVSPPSCCRPSAVLHCATHGGSFTCGGVSNNSPPRRPLWRLHRLLVGCSRPLRVWLSDRHHLGCTQHRRGWCWHSLGQSAWVGGSRNPLRGTP